MREEYDIDNLNPRRNPYAKAFKQQITTDVSNSTVDYFKEVSESLSLPYQTVIGLYLDMCAKEQIPLQLA